MNRMKPAVLFGILFALAIAAPAAETNESHWFHFDKADEIIPSTLLENHFAYDAGIAASKDGLWLAWLEFVPGKGDELWVGLRGKDGWKSKAKLSGQPGDYAKPTVTVDAQEKLWVTYETALTKGNWQVFVRSLQKGGAFSEERIVSSNRAANISHCVAVDPTNGLRVVWQGEYPGRFQISAAWVWNDEISPPSPAFSEIPGNCWSPRATVSPDGDLHIVWDAYDGGSYDVFERSFRVVWHTGSIGGRGYAVATNVTMSALRMGPHLKVASTANFEAHAQIASDKNGKLWMSWEEDGENWGGRYAARLPGRKDSTHMTDKVGPVHRFRRLHLGELDEKNAKLTEYEIPQPSFDLARHRTNAPPDLKDFGAFYENGQLVVDGQNRPWIVYRHFYVPWIGIELATHKQENMRIYARCLLPDGWSKLYSFKEGQGDGMQRISATALPDGVAVAWTTGRTDRRKTPDPHGVAFAEIRLSDAKAVAPAKTSVRTLDSKPAEVSSKARQRPSAELAGKHYELFYGDLHRHTDISLCFSPVDGTIDDAYRYAIDAAPLDFLGITDHTHDLQMGEPLAHIWWRSRKEVNRHALAGKFIPFFSYERSRGDTDHNVISLRDDMLRPHTFPLPDFWKELDTNTFTIPHQPFNPVLWKHRDDVHRPLLEIYQGMRNDIRETDMQEGLSGGHHFGIIASSDHLSTSASFACVWAEQPTRESIFRAMQARRTFGATAQIVLKVTAGEHWMGEEFTTKKMPPLQIEARGTGPIAKVDLLVDGQFKDSLTSTATEVKWTPKLDSSLSGKHVFFVRLEQSDGNHAWSSPLWVEINR